MLQTLKRLIPRPILRVIAPLWHAELLPAPSSKSFTPGLPDGLADPCIKYPEHAPIALPERPRKIPRGYLSIAAIIKNEGPYLAEWLEFHLMLGVEHVYLYENGSTDSTSAVLAPFLRDGFVTILPWLRFDVGRNVQRQAYAHAICTFGAEWRWMAFIDADEFAFPLQGYSLPAALRMLEHRQTVRLPWQMFGTSGHETPPQGGVLANYTQRAVRTRADMLPSGEPFICCKCFVQPAFVTHICSSHRFLTKDESSGEREPRAERLICLHHYYTRSLQEWRDKAARPVFRLNQADTIRRERFAMIEAETVHDGTALRFVPELRRRLSSRYCGPTPAQPTMLTPRMPVV